MDVSSTKRRNRFLAAFASFLIPGLGQIYNTQLKKGLILFGIYLLLGITLLSTPLMLSFAGLLAIPIIGFVFRIYATIDAAVAAKRIGAAELRPYNRWYFYTFIWIIAIGFSFTEEPIVETFRRADLFRIPTPAMEPTLLVGDYIVADTRYYNNRPVKSGDLVVFKPPPNPGNLYVKRCIATDGDTVQVRAGKLLVNNEQAPEHLQGSRMSDRLMPADLDIPELYPEGKGNLDFYGPVVVPQDHCFLMGDTRDNSEDSRFFGPVSQEAVVGKVLYIYFSWNPENQYPRFERIGNEVN